MPSTGHTSTQGTPPSASLHDRGLVPIQDSVITYAIRCHLALALAGLCSQTALAPLARPEAKDPSWEGLLAPPVARTGSHLSSIPAVGSLRCAFREWRPAERDSAEPARAPSQLRVFHSRLPHDPNRDRARRLRRLQPLFLRCQGVDRRAQPRARPDHCSALCPERVRRLYAAR